MTEESEVKQVKRGRGRPPKADSEKKTVEKKRKADDEDETPSVKRGRGRPKGSTKAKGRGRPKKVKAPELKESLEADIDEEAGNSDASH